MISGKFRGIDRRVTIIQPGKDVDSSYIQSFDIDVSEFKEISRLYKKHKDERGNTDRNVIEFDRYNLTDNFHYITLIAPETGVIAQGKGEKRFIKARTKNKQTPRITWPACFEL